MANLRKIDTGSELVGRKDCEHENVSFGNFTKT